MAVKGWDLLGLALKDYYQHQDLGISVKVHSDFSGVETLPLEVFFRHDYSLPDLERYALDLCQGEILDVGAGAGCHSLILQERGLQVTAADISPAAVKVMEQRGIRRILETDVTKWEPKQRFDSVLMLMNGIGLVGDLNGLKDYLDHAKRLIAPEGQLLLDSTDFTHFPKLMKSWVKSQFKQGRYFGVVEYRIEYQGKLSEAYSWLFIDQRTLADYAREAGWFCQVVYEEEGQYLARLTRCEA